MVPAGSSTLPYSECGWDVLTLGCHHLLGTLFHPAPGPVFLAMVVADSMQEAMDKCEEL